MPEYLAGVKRNAIGLCINCPHESLRQLLLACLVGVGYSFAVFSQESILHSFREAQEKAMQKQIENSTLQVIEDAGHAAHLEQPAEFQRGVTVFLAVTLMELAGRQHVEEEHGFRLG